MTHFKNTKYFLLHAVWYEDRAIQLLKFSMSQEVKKGPFAALTFESSKNFILTYFQKLMWFYLLVTKDSLLGQVWGKSFFRCEMPWTALTILTWPCGCEQLLYPSIFNGFDVSTFYMKLPFAWVKTNSCILLYSMALMFPHFIWNCPLLESKQTAWWNET